MVLMTSCSKVKEVQTKIETLGEETRKVVVEETARLAESVNALGDTMDEIKSDAQKLREDSKVTDEELQRLVAEFARLNNETEAFKEAVDARLEVIESHIKENAAEKKEAAAVPTHTPPPVRQPSPKTPPFEVTGVEIRAGVPFVVIAVDPKSVADLYHFKVGDTIAGRWKVKSIEADGVVFLVDGQTVKVAI
jgi:chemotaxis protein histidine kinase CheA